MNISYGHRLDADRSDFHDGIELPAAADTPVDAMADGLVHRPGPESHCFKSAAQFSITLNGVKPVSSRDALIKKR